MVKMMHSTTPVARIIAATTIFIVGASGVDRGRTAPNFRELQR
jgi:hypothetical protein